MRAGQLGRRRQYMSHEQIERMETRGCSGVQMHSVERCSPVVVWLKLFECDKGIEEAC
jgi:hypothetical protein